MAAMNKPVPAPEQRFAELLPGLTDEDEDRMYAAARGIADLGRAVLPQVIALTDDSNPRLRDRACYILGITGDPVPDSLFAKPFPEATPVLIRKLADDVNEGVRASAAHALGHARDPAGIPALLGIVADPSADIRFAASRALGSFGEWCWETPEGARYKAEVGSALLRLMDDEDEDVRDWATFGIHQGSHDTPETRARLWRALDDPWPEVRGEAAAALGKFGDRSFIPRLDRLLREDEDISPCYFEAAVELADPSLLPAVLQAQADWGEGDRAAMIASMVDSFREAIGRTPSEAQEAR